MGNRVRALKNVATTWLALAVHGEVSAGMSQYFHVFATVRSTRRPPASDKLPSNLDFAGF
jgi:hypothetical protein